MQRGPVRNAEPFLQPERQRREVNMRANDQVRPFPPGTQSDKARESRRAHRRRQTTRGGNSITVTSCSSIILRESRDILFTHDLPQRPEKEAGILLNPTAIRINPRRPKMDFQEASTYPARSIRSKSAPSQETRLLSRRRNHRCPLAGLLPTARGGVGAEVTLWRRCAAAFHDSDDGIRRDIIYSIDCSGRPFDLHRGSVR